MSLSTGIEWTDATWNPVRGCSRVSEGCRNCYAERIAARNLPGMRSPTNPLATFAIQTSDGPRWTGKVELIEEKLTEPLHWKKPRRVFVNSMSDLFHESLPDEAIDRVFAVMALCPQHTFQVLTKRPERMRQWCERLQKMADDWAPHTVAKTFTASDVLNFRWMHETFGRGPAFPNTSWPLPNLWLGVSVENQETADSRIPELLRTPAALRFISYEPALGPLGDNLWWLWPKRCVTRIDWVIAGSESGPGSRPDHPDWFRSVRDQCQAAGVPFFMKQITEHGHKVPFEQWPADLKVREMPRC